MADYAAGPAADARPRPHVIRSRDLLRNCKLELAFVALIFATFLAVQFEDLILRRTIIIGPDTKGFFSHAHSDSAAGGTSQAVADQARPFKWVCDLRATYAYPYCAYEWVFDKDGDGSGFDLTRFDRLTVNLTYEGQAKSLRLHLKNYDSRYSKPGNGQSRKFNTAEIPFRSGRQTIRLDTQDFSVAEWWVLEHGVPAGLSHPQFDNVVALEVSSGTGAPLGVHKFQVHKITFHGRFLSKQEWYLVISAAWLALMSFFLIRLRREVGARQEAEERADRYARHDPMTGFLNRRTFGHELDAELASLRERDQQGAVFLIEIEHLTSADNVYGEAAGEALLIEMATGIRNVLGSEAVVGRVRDDEFACLVQGDADRIREKAAELLRRLNRPLQLNGGSINAAATIGIACFPHHGSSYGTLLPSADVALREGKRAGRLIYRFFDPELPRELPDSSEIGVDDELSTFLSAAAMEAVIKESRHIADTCVGGTAVAVHLPIHQLEDEWAANRLITVMTCNGFQPSELVVKVKESCFSRASSTAVNNLETLQRAGIRIVLSDFQNCSTETCSSIIFDHVELADAYLNSRIAAGRRLERKVTPLSMRVAPVVSKVR